MGNIELAHVSVTHGITTAVKWMWTLLLNILGEVFRILFVASVVQKFEWKNNSFLLFLYSSIYKLLGFQVWWHAHSHFSYPGSRTAWADKLSKNHAWSEWGGGGWGNVPLLRYSWIFFFGPYFVRGTRKTADFKAKKNDSIVTAPVYISVTVCMNAWYLSQIVFPRWACLI